jgi:exopolysaccharide biosynthesis polyprenyl glycosylphosphotransferase
MVQRHRQALIKIYPLLDLLIMACTFFAAALAVAHAESGIHFREFISMRIKIQNFVLLGGILFLWHLIFSAFGVYESRRFSSFRAEVIDILKATTVGTVIVASLSFLFHIKMSNNVFLAFFWVACTILTLSSRFLLRYTLRQFRVHGRNLRNVLIVGTNSRAIRFARKIEAKPELGYRIIGFVDDDWSGTPEFHRTGFRQVASLDQFPEFLRRQVVDEVLLCLPMSSYYPYASAIVGQCEEQGIIVRFLSDLFNLKHAKSKAAQFEGEYLLTLYTGTIDGWQAIVKRACDFFLSFVLILLLSPLFLVVALLVKATSPGPVFFLQERLGLRKRRFRICKFRTMDPDAERKQAELEDFNEVDGPAFKITNDPRITPIGRILRKTSIDELPQFFNVLKGDMSLVGPRPLPVRDYEGFDQDWHRRRFSVRPGITCLWQVNGRSNVSFNRWMELDMEYIDKWSLWLDIKILAKTVPVVLKGSGAS